MALHNSSRAKDMMAALSVYGGVDLMYGKYLSNPLNLSSNNAEYAKFLESTLPNTGDSYFLIDVQAGLCVPFKTESELVKVLDQHIDRPLIDRVNASDCVDFTTPIHTVDQAENFLSALASEDRLYNLDDDPHEIIETSTGLRLFSEDEADLMSARVAEIFSLTNEDGSNYDPHALMLLLIGLDRSQLHHQTQRDRPADSNRI